MNELQVEAISKHRGELCNLQPIPFQSFLQMNGLLIASECAVINNLQINVTNEQKILCIFNTIEAKFGSWDIVIAYLRGHKYSGLADKLQIACGELPEPTPLPRPPKPFWANTRLRILFILFVVAVVLIVVVAVVIVSTSGSDTANREKGSKVFPSANSSIGYNMLELPNRDILFLDSFDGGILYTRSVDEKSTKIYRFNPQPPELNQHMKLFNRFGTPSLLMVSPHDHTKLLGISHLINDKWEFHPLDEEIIVSHRPVFAQDQSQLYVFSDNPHESKRFFVAVLKLSDERYVLQRKIDIDFIKTDANFDQLLVPRLLIAGAVVIGPKLFVFYTVPKSFSEAYVDNVAIINIKYGLVVSKQKLGGSAPKYTTSDIFNIHDYKGQVVYASLGLVSSLNLETFEWNEIYKFHIILYNDLIGVSQGSTITAQGHVIICRKYEDQDEIELKSVYLKGLGGLR